MNHIWKDEFYHFNDIIYICTNCKLRKQVIYTTKSYIIDIYYTFPSESNYFKNKYELTCDEVLIRNILI